MAITCYDSIVYIFSRKIKVNIYLILIGIVHINNCLLMLTVFVHSVKKIKMFNNLLNYTITMTENT